MNFLESLGEKRKKFLDGLAVNEDDINLDLFDDFYPDKAHFIYELLQNAEDAEATEVNFRLTSTRLMFEHNGRPFDDKDVRAITGIGFSTKKDDVDSIGRFGIGFKAVFALHGDAAHLVAELCLRYFRNGAPVGDSTESGSGRSHAVRDPVQLREKAASPGLLGGTGTGLRRFPKTPCCSCPTSKRFSGSVDGGCEGLLLRIPHSDHHIEILREIDGRPTESVPISSVSPNPLTGLERQHIAIAFELEPLSGDHPGGYASFLRHAVSNSPGRTWMRCGLLHGRKGNLKPALPSPCPLRSRNSAAPASRIRRQTSRSSGSSPGSRRNPSPQIRDLGLLDREFLAVLPNSQDDIPAPYTTIRDAIAGAMNEQLLTPMHAGGHAPARRLLQAEAGLKDLLDRDDIRFLIDGDDDPRHWAVAATQRNSRVDRFLRGLAIEQWGVEQFVKALDDRCSNRRRLQLFDLHLESRVPIGRFSTG